MKTPLGAKRYSESQKKRVDLAVARGKMTRADVKRELGATYITINSWVAKYAPEGTPAPKQTRSKASAAASKKAPTKSAKPSRPQRAGQGAAPKKRSTAQR